jgi:uncharacterized membrane protein
LAVVLPGLVFYFIQKKNTFEKFGLKNAQSFLILFLVLVIGFGLLAFISVRPSILLFNGILDKTEPQMHWVEISRKYILNFRGRRSCYLKLSDSQSDSDFRDLCVNRDFYDVVNAHDQLELVTGQGEFGLAWVRNYEQAKPR